LSCPYPGPREARPEHKLQRASIVHTNAWQKMDSRFRGNDKYGVAP